MKIKRGHWALAIFNALYLLIFAIFYISQKNYEFLWYIAVVVFLALIILFTLKYSKLNYLALWGLSIWGLLHMLGGSIRINGGTLYSQRLIEIINKGGDYYILKMDQLIHFYGSFVAAIVIYQLIVPLFSEGHSKRIIFLAWIGSMGLGALNEVVEFIALLVFAKTGVGDMYNTGFDLIFNMLGALCGALLSNYLDKK